MGKLKIGAGATRVGLGADVVTTLDKPIIKTVEVERIVEVEVPKYVEVPTYIDREVGQDFSKFYEVLSQEKGDLLKSIDSLGESCAESFDSTLKNVEVNREVINRHAALIIYLKAQKDINNKNRKRLLKKTIKANNKQKYINRALAAVCIVSLLVALIK